MSHQPSSDMSDHDLLVEAVERLRTLDSRVGEHDQTLYGDGGYDNPGMRVRLDRLEQESRLQKWLAALMVTVGLGAVADFIFRK